MEYTLNVNRNNVMREVSQTTHYVGAKLENDLKAYNRISTTDEDEAILSRFWNESKDLACDSFKQLLASEDETTVNNITTYAMRLSLSSDFDTALLGSMERSLFSYFVANIIAKWFAFVNKSETTAYTQDASKYLEDVRRKAFYKKKPTRPRHN